MTFHLRDDIQNWLDNYDAIPNWDTHRTERIPMILPTILEHVEGDILEIGAHEGCSTKVFCSLGAEYYRQVYVIDPWDGRQQGDSTVYQQFIVNTKDCKNLTIYRLGSENSKICENFETNNIKFAFILIDGLHSYHAIINDLTKYQNLLTPGGIICIDDWQGPYAFSAEIQRGTKASLNKSYYKLVTPISFIENYFMKPW